MKITTTKGHIHLIDDEDADLAQYKWTSYGQEWRYAKLSTNYRQVLHRIILERKIGRVLESSERPDHINGDSYDSRRSNLRVATHTQNMMNRKMHRNNKTGFKGVYRNREKFVAFIGEHGNAHYLGIYDTPEEAYKAYLEAAQKYHGEFAAPVENTRRQS